MAMKSPSSSSSSFSYGFSFDVFISFRGTDTRHGFTGNLYKALSNAGIRTFIDDKDLQRGDEITPSLFKSIEDSKIAIIVFSKDYASSSFCLDELVHIIRYFKEKGRLVLPVFYDVEPTDVRHHNNRYGEALAEFEQRFQNNKENVERLHKWKIALNQASNLSGFHFKKDENEYEFIKEIVTEISNKINRGLLEVADHLVVGLDSRLLHVKSLLDFDCDNVCIIGIYGSGGLGKTTLTRAVYNLIADQFEGLCFLHNVRENSIKYGLEYLQEKLLSKLIGLEFKFGDVSEGIPIIKHRLRQKKVLLILDDVDKLKQLRALVGEPAWFGHGSRVIITTRDKHLLSCHGIKRIYELDAFNQKEALELLRKMAFKSNKYDSSYDYILTRAVKYASGLPLALEVVGSNLYGKSIAECESLLDKYDRIPHEDIQKILKVSYDALDEEQQSVFLDIACVFRGGLMAYVQEWLHENIPNNIKEMQQVGYDSLDEDQKSIFLDIACFHIGRAEECISRYCLFEDILYAHYSHCIKHHVPVLADKSLIKISESLNGGIYVTLHDLIEDMGKEIVRQESIKEPGERSRLWCRDDIVHLLQENKGTSKIEMIYLNCPSMEPIDMNEKAFKKMTNLKTLIIEKGHFSKGLKYLPSSLRVLKWRGFTSESLSSCFSNKKKFNNMKILTLDHSYYLTHIPDVSGLPNLEKLSFRNCHSLITIHNSVGYLNKLEILNAKECIKLESFPPLQLASLKKLELSGCKSLKRFPELLCNMTNIEEIELQQISIEELPFSFGNLIELRRLTISCVNFKILPECLSECHHLVDINVNDCESLEKIRGIPPNLEKLSARGCESLCPSTRRMLLSQKLHAARSRSFSFPNGSEGIPDWFEHRSRENTISFWFRKKIPSITCIFLIPVCADLEKFKLFLNDNENEITPTDYLIYIDEVLPLEQAYLFDLKLVQRINESFANKPYLYEAFKINEWNHVELNWKIRYWSDSAQMGIHVSWKGDDFIDTEESNTEGDVVFTNPILEEEIK